MFGAPNRKQCIEKWGDLPPKIAGQIPNVRENETLIEIRNQIASLEREDDEIRAQLETEAGKRTDDRADAERLIESGQSVQDVCSTDTSASLDRLHRQRRVLGHAIAARKDELHRATVKAIRNESARLEPIARQHMESIFDVVEHLHSALQRAEVFYTHISRKGFRTDYRPAHWKLLPFEQQLLYGTGGMPSVVKYLSERREAWGMANPKSKKRKVS